VAALVLGVLDRKELLRELWDEDIPNAVVMEVVEVRSRVEIISGIGDGDGWWCLVMVTTGRYLFDNDYFLFLFFSNTNSLL